MAETKKKKRSRRGYGATKKKTRGPAMKRVTQGSDGNCKNLYVRAGYQETVRRAESLAEIQRTSFSSLTLTALEEHVEAHKRELQQAGAW